MGEDHELDTAIAHISVLDDVMTNAATPGDAVAQLKAAYSGHTGDFLLSLIGEYWTR